MALVTKQMYPVGKGKSRTLDYRCLHQVGESEGSFPSILWMFVFQQKFCCLHGVKLEERDALLPSPESSNSDWTLELRMLSSRWGDNGTSFFCYTLSSVDFLLSFVRLSSQCSAIQGCSWKRKFFSAYKHVFMSSSDFNFSLEVYVQPLLKGKNCFMLFLLSGSVHMPGVYWAGGEMKCSRRQAVQLNITRL